VFSVSRTAKYLLATGTPEEISLPEERRTFCTDSSHIKIVPMDDERTLWKLCEKKTYNVCENNVPIYNQILENEWILCYELSRKMGGQLVAIRTDCVVCEVDKCEVEDIDGAIKFARLGLDESPIGGVKLAENKEISMEIIPKKNKKMINIRNTWDEVEETEFKNEDLPFVNLPGHTWPNTSSTRERASA
jgi:hypothetical protein